MNPDSDRATHLIQEAQAIQNNLGGVSESRKMILAAMQVEATALVARSICNLEDTLAKELSWIRDAIPGAGKGI